MSQICYRAFISYSHQDETWGSWLQRRHRLWMVSSMAALVVAVVTTVLAIMAITARNAADNRREHAEWIIEMSYAHSNMGSLEQSREASNSEKILEYMESALEYNSRAVKADPANTDIRIELTQSYADLANAHLRECNLGNALDYRKQNVELAAKFHDAQPGDANLKADLAYAVSGLAFV